MWIVLGALVRWVEGVARRTVERVEAAVLIAARPASVVGGLLRDVVRSREELIAENTLLRQQLLVAARTVKKPRFTRYERGLLMVLARLVPRWRDALLVVKPETILRWHRDGFRLFWRARSRPPEVSASRIGDLGARRRRGRGPPRAQRSPPRLSASGVRRVACDPSDGWAK
jgi:hypothetical protein